MINLKYVKYLKFIGMGASVAFTIIMLQTFASSIVEHVIYAIAGFIPEICKIILLLSGMYFYYQKKSLGVKLFILFIPFFCISLVGSISFVIYTVQKQMYIVEISEDIAHIHSYEVIQGQINVINDNITILEAERIEERNRFNALIDSLPAADVAQRRRLLEDRELLMESYETRISNMRMDIHIKEGQLVEITTDAVQSQNIVENRRLNNNSVAGFFSTISNITGAEIETIILWYAILLGIILDSCGVALAYVEAKQNANLNEKNLKKDKHDVDENDLENEEIFDNEIVSDTDEDDAVLPTEDSEIKISKSKNTYENFKKCIAENDLDVASLKYTKFLEYHPEARPSTFQKHIKKYRKELGIL